MTAEKDMHILSRKSHLEENKSKSISIFFHITLRYDKIRKHEDTPTTQNNARYLLNKTSSKI